MDRLKNEELEVLRAKARNGSTYKDAMILAAKELFSELPDSALDEMFGKGKWSYPSIMELSPQEAIAKIKAHKYSKEIRRGDEVMHIGGRNAIMVVSLVTTDGDSIYGIGRTGDLYSGADPSNWRKTGRNFADKLDALLGEIGGDS